MVQVTHEARLVDRTDRTDAHRASGELPEVRHQPRVRVARQPPSTLSTRADLLPIMLQVPFFKAPFQIRSCIHAGRRVRLVEHQVTAAAVGTGLEKMVEAHLEQIGGAGITGNVAAELTVGLIGPGDHDQRIPAHDRSQAFFHRQVSGEHRLLLDADGIDVRRAMTRSPTDIGSAGQCHQPVHDLPCLFGTAMGDYR
ncbi:hypothetical protein D3C73_922470 [compost metagenome]